MRDAVELGGKIVTARLMRGLDEGECRRRNALSLTRPGLALRQGDEVQVVETFGTGEAFLVEFHGKAKAKADQCEWMGVLYPTEIEVVGTTAEKR
ncbi:MAG: hypothetical protein AB7K67_04475 [Hyphomicrobiaceae bacterium]|jgi:hypothetical protein